MRLGVISLLLAEMRAGVPLTATIEQLHVELIHASIARLRLEIARLPDVEPTMPVA